MFKFHLTAGFFPAWQLQYGLTIARYSERAAIKYQLILTANLIGIKDRNTVAFDMTLHQSDSLFVFAHVEWRGIEIQNQLRTLLSGLCHRLIKPDVFTHGEA